MDEELIIHSQSSEGLAPQLRTTFSEVMADPTINATFGGKDGKLSPAQAGLAAAITSRMQDRLIEYMNRAHKRELGLIGGFLRLYRTPVFSAPQIINETSDNAKEAKASGFAELFSWGNMLGGAGLILVAASFFLTNYYTKLSASYEEHWKAAEMDSTKFKGLYEESSKQVKHFNLNSPGLELTQMRRERP